MEKSTLPASCINDTGGLDILMDWLKKQGVWELIDNRLGKRHGRAEYSYSDAIQTWTMNILCGSNRLENSLENTLKFKSNPSFKKGMSPDTISRILRRLSCDNTHYELNQRRKNKKQEVDRPKKYSGHEVNYNQMLNELLIDVAIKTGALHVGNAYSVDIDATIVDTRVGDSRRHYKLYGTGYCPMVVVLGGIPLFFENRNGNSGPAFRKKEVLENAINLFLSRGINIDFVRIDAAGCNKYIVDYLLKNKFKFYIRATADAQASSDFIAQWRPVHDMKLYSRDSDCTIGEHELRMVDYTSMVKDKYDDEAESVFSIVTNDLRAQTVDVIKTYTQRGAIEQRFSDLKAMGWHYLVHRNLKFNTVHMAMTMMAFIFFYSSKIWLSKKVEFVKENMEPKTFMKKFIKVLTVWVGEELKFLSRQKEFALFRDLQMPPG